MCVAVVYITGVDSDQPTCIECSHNRACGVAVVNRACIVANQCAHIGGAGDGAGDHPNILNSGGGQRTSKKANVETCPVDDQVGNGVAQTIKIAAEKWNGDKPCAGIPYG